MSHAGQLSIYLYIPGNCILKVRVSKSSPVSDLKKILRNEQAVFIYNGTMLDEKGTFQSYDLKDSEVIVALSSKYTSFEIERWMNATRDSDAFVEKIDGIVNQKTLRESARLRDFQLAKMERKPRAFRRLCATYRSFSESAISITSSDTTLSFNMPSSPSTDPLPIFWDSPVPQTTVGDVQDTEPIDVLTVNDP